MKETADPDKDSGPKTLNHSAGLPDHSLGLGTHLGGTHLANHTLGNFGIQHPLHQHFLAQLASPVGLRYPSLFQNNLNSAAIMASLSNRHEHLMRGCPPILPSSGRPPSIPNFHATLAAADVSRHSELFNYFKDNATNDFFSVLSKFATTTSISSTSSSLSSSSLSSSSSPSSSSFHNLHQDSPIKLEISPPENRSSRPSSLSPSTYMTPRSLNGSPSMGTHLLSPRNIGTRTFGNEGMSPSLVGSSSNLTMNSRVDSTSMTPTRKASTPKTDRVFTCRTCNRSFGYKHVLQNHERTHTGEKPFECKQCNKKFTRDHHLKTHMRLHTGEKPYSCNQCERQFVQVANLRRHLRVHTGEKPYACEICSSKFSDSNQLKAHVLIHKGEKPFPCTKCTRIFRRKHHLTHHKCSTDAEAEHPFNVLGFNKDLLYSEIEAPHYRDLYPDREDNMDEDSMPASTILEDEPQIEKRRGRKSKEPRRVVHPDEEIGAQTSVNITPPADNRLNGMLSNHQLPPTPLPEQTEPEDLSINGPRSRGTTYHANIALTTTGYSNHPLRYPKEEFMSDDDGQVQTGV